MPAATEKKQERIQLQARSALAEKSAYFTLAILMVYATARSICEAIVRPFGYDEICTVLMVKQEHLSRLWQAYVHGADGQPLGYYLLERGVIDFIPNEHLAYRGISILAFAVTLLCLFVTVRTRKGAGLALVGAGIPLVTILFDTLCVEARPYSLLVACIAFAIVCYQRVEARRWVVLLGLSLVLAESIHYLAVFAFLPFFLAEAVRYGMTREMRLSVWIALLSGFVPLVYSMPILNTLNRNFAAHIWSRPTLEIAMNSYSWYFLNPESWPGLYLAAIASVVVLFTILMTLRKASKAAQTAGAPIPELMLVLGLLSLPLVGFTVAALAHSGMIAKYMVPSLLGFPLALGFALPRLPQWGPLLPSVTACLLLFVLVPQERQYWSRYTGEFVSPAVFVENFVTAGGQTDLPVLVSDPHEFMVLQHYCDNSWRKRFVSVIDAEQAVVYTGNDSADKQLEILRQYTSLPVYDFEPFLAEHPRFLLYSSNGGLQRDWWPVRLKNDGFKMKNVSVRPLEAHDYFHRVVLVTR
jgi:Dolichyl-phosphate-mannose-protein mannosyltransferase